MNSKAKATAAPRLKIGFVLARSFTLSAFAMFVDTLRLASDELDRSGRVLADWQVLGSTRHLITSSCGVQVAPTSDFVDPSQFNYIVVVGGLLNVEHPVDDATTMTMARTAVHTAVLAIMYHPGLEPAGTSLPDGLTRQTRDFVRAWLKYSSA